MTARIVLRKRIRSFDESIARLVESNISKLQDGEFREDLRELAEILPHIVDIQGDIAKQQYTTESGDLGDDPVSERPRSQDTFEETQKFLTVWGLALRANSKESRTGQVDEDWWENQDPESVRSRLLESSDVLTEVLAVDGSVTEPRGDIPNIDLDSVPTAERKAIAVDLEIEISGYLGTGQHWDTRTFLGPSSGTARDAMRLIDATWVLDREFEPGEEATGQNINVVVVDTGLNEDYLRSLYPAVDFGGGFVKRPTTNPQVGTSSIRPDPGDFLDSFASQPLGHGNMIARNILRIAPKARIWDAPLLPDRVADIDRYTSELEHLYEAIREERSTSGYADQPWLIVNAWAVANTISEKSIGISPQQFYTSGAAHNTTALIQNMSDEFGIVFAAGNNGLFQPSQGAGLYDRGPFYPGEESPSRLHGSISGANALPGVLTIGSCDVLGQWIGSSSQGETPGGLAQLGQGGNVKPDIVAPSWFAETTNRHVHNTGSSAACAVCAGVIAANWSTRPELSPQSVFQRVRDGAQMPFVRAPSESSRIGVGVLRADFL